LNNFILGKGLSVIEARTTNNTGLITITKLKEPHELGTEVIIPPHAEDVTIEFTTIKSIDNFIKNLVDLKIQIIETKIKKLEKLLK
jgi:hypothetical protein